ncbi:MAG: rhodanese-like domain-containing protein [Candidatus Bipolaricaulota bacterium]|nr:rhodanese-like domain-containing protein [Candidatus Bipolaricaulota bacterium]MCX7843898.1 rhodanese-like domain-containing protein [Candidatus Bipolaricaulota bacterium]MDW8151478.1 rhodanese-like domain-containing protein [Candidatus Bipolaricaulota bacterium]
MRTVLVSLLVLGAALAGLAAPRLQVDRELFDFGVAADGEVVEFLVTLTNVGTQRLSIQRVQYNCACTSYELPKRELNPGESVQMRIRFNTRGYSAYPQPVAQTLTLYTNDPVRPQVTLTVRGTVRTLSGVEAPAASLYQGLYLLLDVREPAEFARVRLLGALNVPLRELEAWAERLPKTHVIYVYDETGERSAQAVALLQRKGFLLVRAIRGGLVGWWQELGDLFLVWGEGVTPTPPQGPAFPGAGFTETPSRVARNFTVVVDVRRPEEFKAGRIAGALNVPLFTMEELVAWAKALPLPRPGYALHLWIVDEEGTRACSIAAYLRNQGFADAKCLFGGMRSWTNQYGAELLWSF